MKTIVQINIHGDGILITGATEIGALNYLFMKLFRIIILIFCCIQLTTCFSYKKQLKKYDANSKEYLNTIDHSVFSQKDIQSLKGVEEVHGNKSVEHGYASYMLYLYKREYNVSYTNDTLNYERRENFAKDFMKWIEGTY